MGGCGSGRQSHYNARRTVESCQSIDVRHWHRNGYLTEAGIRLATTDCNFGGARYWFVCPVQGCSRRVATLYLSGGRYACRHCHALAYRTQHENHYGRALLKAQRIRMKLGGSANMQFPFPDKPKHMHWRTYYRLATADQRGLTRWITGMQAWLDSQKQAR